MKYEEWPEDFKKNFKQLMKSTKRARCVELKNKFKTQYNTYYRLTEDLLKLQMNCEDKPEDKSMNEANSEILDTLMYNILPFLISVSGKIIIDDLKICKINTMYKEYKNIYANIEDQLNLQSSFCDLRMPGPCTVVDQLKEIISEDLCDKDLFFYLNDDKGWTDTYKCIGNSDSLDPHFLHVRVTKEITHLDPDLIEQMQSVLKNNYFSLIILAMSFINLKKSIDDMNEIEKEWKKLETYDEEFKKIQKDFNSVKNKIKNLPDKIKDAIEFIQVLYNEISDIRERLINHINSIEESIENTKKLKKKSLIGMAYSGVLGLISLGGTILSGNVVSTAVNGFSFVSNAYSGEQYYKNYKKCKDILKQLKKKLERAKQLREEINQFIEKFVSILKAKKFSQ